MTENGHQDPRLQTPTPPEPQADDGGLGRGLHRQTPNTGDPGHRTHERMHGIGPSRNPVDGFQRTRNVEKRLANCTGIYQTGNCNSDTYWRPARDGLTGDWRNYPGIGGTATKRQKGSIMTNNPSNPSAFDFLNETNGSTPNPILSQYDVPIYSAYSTVSDTPLEIVKERTVQNCDCGVGGAGDPSINCYTNCACACINCQNCACACHTCFPAGTLVTMAGGNHKSIEHVQKGDLVKGAFEITNHVDDIFIGPIGDFSAYLINGQYFVPGAHRLWSIDRGWVAAKPEDWYRAMATPSSMERFADIHGVEDPPEDGIYAPESERPKQMAVGDRLAWGTVNNWLTVETIEEIDHDGDIILYELITHNGSGSYEIHGGLWAVGAPDYSFPFQDYLA